MHENFGTKVKHFFIMNCIEKLMTFVCMYRLVQRLLFQNNSINNQHLLLQRRLDWVGNSGMCPTCNEYHPFWCYFSSYSHFRESLHSKCFIKRIFLVHQCASVNFRLTSAWSEKYFFPSDQESFFHPVWGTIIFQNFRNVFLYIKK